MRLLFDLNLSHRLVEMLAPLYLGSSDVRPFGLQSADDEVIWEFARLRDFTIVSKDSEFHQRSFLLGFPPKIIWVRLGNCSTHQVATMLQAFFEVTCRFCEDEVHACLLIP